MYKRGKDRQVKNPLKNKKVKNATKCSYDGIDFRSRLELYCYKKLKEHNISFGYESVTYTLFIGKKPNFVQFYDPDKTTKKLKLNSTKLSNTTYTPDFIGNGWIIETKGIKSPSYSIKMKMLRQMLEDKGESWIILEPHNQAQIDQAIQLIKEL